MGRFDTTKATINANIKQNGKQAITGSILNSVMTEMVDATDAQLTELGQEVAQKANKTDIATPDWNITAPSEKGYILNRTHGIDARLKTAKGTLTELLGGVFSQYVPVIHYDNGELLIRHLYLNGAVIEPEVGKEYQVLYSGSSVFAKIEEDGVGGYDVLLKGDSDTGAIVEISVVTIKKLDSPYIPDEIARTEQVDEVREETLAIWEHLEDGYAPNFAVGVADQLAGQDEPTASEINFRRSGGGAILDGVARIESIKGNSVVWNQQSSGESLGGDNGTTKALPQGARIVQGHKYLILCDKVVNSELYLYYNDGEGKTLTYLKAVSYKFIESSVSFTANGQANTEGCMWWYLTNASANDARPRLIDLTQMFQAGNEPTTIEEFYARKPIVEDEYAYNEGEVIHMDVQSIESVGVNQWDEEWELGYLNSTGVPSPADTRIRTKNFTRVIPNETYYFHGVFGYGIFFYDANKSYVTTLYVNNKKLQIPSNAMYLKFNFPTDYGTTYKGDYCINISDPSINGKYFPYVKRMQNLDIIRKYFPDGMKSVGTAHDEIRYNKATQKWEYSKGKIKSVDLGDLEWIVTTINNAEYFMSSLNKLGAKIFPMNQVQNYLSSHYEAASVLAYNKNADKTIALNNGYYNSNDIMDYIAVRDTAYTDVASFKAAMQGVILYYESNDWEWVELDKEDQLRNFDYQVWNCGTEQAIAEGQTSPLKADIVYGFNAYGTIKQLKEQMATLMTQMAQMAQMQVAMTSNIVE